MFSVLASSAVDRGLRRGNDSINLSNTNTVVCRVVMVVIVCKVELNFACGHLYTKQFIKFVSDL
jgi:hypothetical protein